MARTTNSKDVATTKNNQDVATTTNNQDFATTKTQYSAITNTKDSAITNTQDSIVCFLVNVASKDHSANKSPPPGGGGVCQTEFNVHKKDVTKFKFEPIYYNF